MVDQFSHKNDINNTPYSVIFPLLIYQLISHQTGVNKLFFYMSFSNRNLPIPHAKELLVNLSTGLPVFFDGTDLSPKELALQIKNSLTLFFKNMSYGKIIQLWENQIISRDFLSMTKQPYCLIISYMNKLVEDEYIQNNYIDWQHSSSEINTSNKGTKGMVYIRIYDMGPYFVLNLFTQLKKNLHVTLINRLKKLMGIELQAFNI